MGDSFVCAHTTVAKFSQSNVVVSMRCQAPTRGEVVIIPKIASDERTLLRGRVKRERHRVALAALRAEALVR